MQTPACIPFLSGTPGKCQKDGSCAQEGIATLEGRNGREAPNSTGQSEEEKGKKNPTTAKGKVSVGEDSDMVCCSEWAAAAQEMAECGQRGQLHITPPQLEGTHVGH